MTFSSEFSFKSTPVAVVPEHPSQLAVYAVASAEFVSPSVLFVSSSSLLSSVSSSDSFVSSSTASSDSLLSSSVASSSFDRAGACSAVAASLAPLSSLDSAESSDSFESLDSLSICKICAGWIRSLSKSLLSINELTSTLYSLAISQRVSPFSTSYSSAETLVAAPNVKATAAADTINFFIFEVPPPLTHKSYTNNFIIKIQ